MTICARIASSPPVKQNAIATHSAASVIGGSAALFRSGQGRCSRPDVAVIFAASQRLSVSVIMATIAAAAGAIVTSASIKLFDLAGRTPHRAVPSTPQQAAPQRAGDGGGIGAKRQQGRHRGQRGKARDPEQDAADRIPFEIGSAGDGAVADGDAR